MDKNKNIQHPYLKYFAKNQDKVEKTLKEKINNLIKSDQRKRISILEKSVTDSEGKLDNLKKLLNEYYMAEINSDNSKDDKKKNLIEELNRTVESGEITNKASSNDENLEKEQKKLEETLTKFETDMSITANASEARTKLNQFIENNKNYFIELKLGKEIGDFKNNINNLIKEIESKQK